ncbi:MULTISPECIES: sensor histidine kinase [Streptomyces]|uniref:Putative two-component sensor kinase n=1 Tax=Streptomyces scabiei (strain 87.22) TaxID=680198 RepID=C9ZCC8_STRSW|nr:MULTISPECIES: histidine kinase [Streptomyces]MBP5863891.1 two-component sensor histidine kinase [Streptomyces sp. LBUM 1484]MBP5867140.1 two-component sensor histidine kinase [Streptomyces sp. LBUM 1485]KFG08306.1 histidine kinase [Streptomyces scabiei]MBP5875487.1 two-component sensor histidine kinase [Streptomyces sp. LBUM 1477]MBP5883307.1 two-component sensor histidine kinase [Streptomyces sp. LBUM 1487]
MEAAAPDAETDAGISLEDTADGGVGGNPPLSAAVRFLGLSAPPPRLARSVVLIVECGFVLTGFLNIADAEPGPLTLVFSALGFSLVFLLQLVHTAQRFRRFRARWHRWTLTAQALMTYLPLFVLGFGWGGMAGFLGASVLLVLRPQVAWPLFGLVAVAAAATGPLLGKDLVDSAYITVATVLTGLIVYGLNRLAQLVVEVHAAQTELARLAVTQERLRFARDLHDLLGFSLSAVTLKSELACRLVPAAPDRALEELRSILEISRQALSDVRTVARGYRDMSLTSEAVSAQAVLAAAGIQAEVRCSAEPPEGEVNTIMATVLREAITNLLRHSKAEHCRIDCRRTSSGKLVLTIANDGVQKTATGFRDPSSGADGSGLGNLQFRLASIGGRLTSGLDEEGWFVLRATAPLHRPARRTG